MLLTTPMIFIGAGLMIYAYRRNTATGNLAAVEGLMRQYLDSCALSARTAPA